MDDSKSFFCKHNIGLSIKLKNYKVHHIIIYVPLDEKQKGEDQWKTRDGGGKKNLLLKLWY